MTGSVPIDDWLKDLKKRDRRGYARCVAYIKRLAECGFELSRPTSAPLREGIFELRPTTGNVQYRILYFFYRSTAFLSHGIRKEGAVGQAEIETASRHKKLVQSNMEKYSIPH